MSELTALTSHSELFSQRLYKSVILPIGKWGRDLLKLAEIAEYSAAASKAWFII